MCVQLSPLFGVSMLHFHSYLPETVSLFPTLGLGLSREAEETVFLCSSVGLKLCAASGLTPPHASP